MEKTWIVCTCLLSLYGALLIYTILLPCFFHPAREFTIHCTNHLVHLLLSKSLAKASRRACADKRNEAKARILRVKRLRGPFCIIGFYAQLASA